MLLKAVIFSIRDVILPRAGNNTSKDLVRQVNSELTKLFNYLESKGIQVIFSTNVNRPVNKSDGSVTTLDNFLKNSLPNSKHYCSEINPEIPRKQTGQAIDYILNDLNLNKNEVIYIGRSEEDLRAATNGKVLFLNATWYEPVNDYGFLFSSAKEIAKFIDVFCMREHCWGWTGVSGSAKYYALAPFSTYKEDFRFYSENARNQAKLALGSSDFWFKYLASSIYFSGLSDGASFITTYVGHNETAPYKLGGIMETELRGLAVCFRGKFLKDLFIRHTTADKSQHLRQRGGEVAITNQFNTVKINPYPIKNLKTGSRYVSPPKLKNKTIIVIDDFCTEGNAHETARIYLESLGANVISISWLKTINTDVKIYHSKKRLNPYETNTLQQTDLELSNILSYRANLIGSDASDELNNKIRQYDHWDWPQ
ncbi:Uncharacterised protein [Klebsiella pneumoniae]|nr:Uncharacterised protein [Klebsiella pneumoniae]